MELLKIFIWGVAAFILIGFLMMFAIPQIIADAKFYLLILDSRSAIKKILKTTKDPETKKRLQIIIDEFNIILIPWKRKDKS